MSDDERTQDRPDPDDVRDLLGAFALGAVDDDERAQVADLVLHDTEARAELHQLEHAVAWLGHASPRPSEASWARVRDEMAGDLAADAGAGRTTPDPDAPAELAPVVDLADRRSRPRWQRVAAVAAAVLLVAAFGLGLASVFTDDGADTTTVALSAPDGRVAVTARMDTEGAGEIVASKLPTAPSGHEYQLWYQAGTEAMHSAGLLGTDPDGHRFRMPADASRVAISVEPTGGSEEPTTDPVAISAPF